MRKKKVHLEVNRKYSILKSHVKNYHKPVKIKINFTSNVEKASDKVTFEQQI